MTRDILIQTHQFSASLCSWVFLSALLSWHWRRRGWTSVGRTPKHHSRAICKAGEGNVRTQSDSRVFRLDGYLAVLPGKEPGGLSMIRTRLFSMVRSYPKFQFLILDLRQPMYVIVEYRCGTARGGTWHITTPLISQLRIREKCRYLCTKNDTMAPLDG